MYSSIKLELYSDSIFCNPEQQKQPRPNNWYSVKPITELVKFSWLTVQPIAFESSFKSAHDPLGPKWFKPEVQIIDEHTRYKYPFGVLSFEAENELYWRHSAINYLIDYNEHYAKRNCFQALIDDLEPDETTPAHWVEIVEQSSKDMEIAKAKFKTCRQYQKSRFGLISYSQLPPAARKAVTSLIRLKAYIKHIPHNQVKAANCTELFLAGGFEQLAKSAFYSDAITNIDNTTLDKKFSILLGYVKELVVEPSFTNDTDSKAIEAQLTINYDHAMHYFLSFTSRTYGSIQHLNGFKELSLKYGDIKDVTQWFDEENLAYSS